LKIIKQIRLEEKAGTKNINNTLLIKKLEKQENEEQDDLKSFFRDRAEVSF
jgi:hypothetical protein